MALLLNLLILVTVSSGEIHPDVRKGGRRHTQPDGEHDPHYDHEAFLGDPDEAEMFDELSPEEAKDRLRQLAKKMDKDDDGFIDEKELRNWLSRSMEMLSRSEAETNFIKQDTDQNGFVEWKEYEAFELKNLGQDEEDATEVSPGIRDMLDEDKRLFDFADVEKDGKLAINEYKLFSDPNMHLDEMAMAVLYMTHQIQDVNKDGKIDFDEYMRDRSKNQNVEWFKEEKKAFQSTLDKNGDGTLDKQEIIDWLRTDLEAPEEEQTAHLISEADKNRDGKLSMEEIVGNHEIFVGSEVTNYGVHLHNVERFDDEL